MIPPRLCREHREAINFLRARQKMDADCAALDQKQSARRAKNQPALMLLSAAAPIGVARSRNVHQPAA